ncbi:FAD-binding oxidoreductase [Streptomyces sp. NBC_01602]|uniref:FAD-binding oxidoreductase n=1 Tax=Streptomyces sp. NBC_01602 TaxID=2975893 RepID=UPI00386EE2EB
MISRRSLIRAGGGIVVAGAAVAAGTGPVLAAVDRWSSLRAGLQGDLFTPSDAGYDQAKQGQIVHYDALNPVAVAFCEIPEDVRLCVRFAERHDIPLRVRSGGHNLNGWSTGGGLVIDVSRISHAVPAGSTVHVGPGTQSVDALATLSPLNKQLITGTCPTVCAGGFVSGGGLGFQSRKFGTASDRVVSARVVLADGRIVRCSPSSEPELFWAIRGGGGGNFGVVVDFEVRPIGAPRIVTYDTMWSWKNAAEVFSAWQQWTTHASRNLGSSLIVLSPAASGGGTEPAIRIYGGYHGPKAELDAALAELTQRTGVAPLSSTSSDEAFAEGMQHLYGCGELTVPQCHRTGTTPGAQLYRTPFQMQSYRFSDRTATAGEVDTLLSTFVSDPSIAYQFIQVFALGGAVNDPSPGASAYVHRSAQFLIGYQSSDTDPDPDAALLAKHTAWTDRATDALAPLSGGAYINFPNSRVTEDWEALNYGSNASRVRLAKRRYDPDGVFAHPGSIHV